jgi:hypothetical protein
MPRCCLCWIVCWLFTPFRDKLARILLHGSKLLDGVNAALSCISHLCEQVREGQPGRAARMCFTGCMQVGVQPHVGLRRGRLVLWGWARDKSLWRSEVWCRCNGLDWIAVGKCVMEALHAARGPQTCLGARVILYCHRRCQLKWPPLHPGQVCWVIANTHSVAVPHALTRRWL